MTKPLKQAYAADVKVRTEGLEGLSKQTLTVNVHEIRAAGAVYREGNVAVSAIEVSHGSWQHAFGYRIEAGGRTIVISGDTAPSEAIVEACRGCDVLVHEVYSADGFALAFGPGGSQYHSRSHTSTTQLAELAAKSKPELLVLYHQLYFMKCETVGLVKEIRRTYTGEVLNGRDLEAY